MRFAEYFGFTDDEVKEMLRYYGLSDKFEVFKEWYDGEMHRWNPIGKTVAVMRL